MVELGVAGEEGLVVVWGVARRGRGRATAERRLPRAMGGCAGWVPR